MDQCARALGVLPVLLMIATSALGQERPRVELELGLGYVIDRSVETEPPSTGTRLAGLTFWWARAWGGSVVRIVSRGFSLNDPPVEISDRVFLGSQNLRYVRIAVRHRRVLTQTTTLLVGAGIFRGSYEDVTLRKTASGLRKAGSRLAVVGIAGEIYLDGRLMRYLGLRVGATAEGVWEARMIQPVFLGVISF